MRAIPAFRSLALLFVLLPVSGTLFAQSSTQGEANPAPILHLNRTMVPTRYNHQLSTPQIEKLGWRIFRLKNWHENGLCHFEFGYSFSYKVSYKRPGNGGPYQVWADSIDVKFLCKRMDVYVSRKYPEGSCEYKAILDHENQHVSINTTAFNKYGDLLEGALRGDLSLPTRSRPMAVSSIKAGERFVQSRIDRLIGSYFESLKREVKVENAKIDTIENYKRVTAQCHHW
jgi:hypothetical protein